ncbi:MAG: segregation/condensation protein A [Propionibacteriaceae bacterium]|jgi:segregation and condensation protein A|nr:segregation/condensation protein A [Propionibacteriaceae bacterium]
MAQDASSGPRVGGESPFAVRLSNFEGPFDLLLSLIAKHKLDITEVALSQVTDEFIGYIRLQGPDWNLDQASQFLVIGATLLDLKTARLLPQGEVDDEDDLALLEARDLLFARLLQYRAFKQVAAWIQKVLAEQADRLPRPGGLEAAFAQLLPEVQIQLSPAEFAALAARAMIPAEAPEVSTAHIWAPQVSVAEEAALLAERLRGERRATFRTLVADAANRLVVVARFLAVLEFFRSGLVAFEQLDPLADLVLAWIGDDDTAVEVVDDYDALKEGS